MYQASAEHFTEVASLRRWKPWQLSCFMLPAAREEGTFVIPILYLRGWAPGLWGAGRGTREPLSGRTAGGQEQGLRCCWGKGEVAVQLGRGPAQAAVKQQPALLQAEPQQFCWLSSPSSWDRPRRPDFLEGCPSPTPLHPHTPSQSGWPAVLPPSPGWGDPRKIHISVSRWTLPSALDCRQSC